MKLQHFVVVLVFFVFVGILTVWLQVKSVMLGIEIGDQQKTVETLREENRLLNVKIQSVSALRRLRIENAKSESPLVPPGKGQER